MANTFTLPFQGDAATLVDRAKQAAAQNNVIFQGDENSGTFSGKGIIGGYTVAGQNVTITITQKPFYLPMSMIQSRVTGFFAS